MSVDTQKIIEIVKQVKPLFLDREGSSQIKVKGVADFVTQIDFKVQEQVKTALYELYPEIQFMGEEKDNSDIDFDGDVWILDPVDGTTNLIHDFRNSTLSLALARKGVLTLGIIYHPYSDEIFVAERGKGALLNGSPISVSKSGSLNQLSKSSNKFSPKILGIIISHCSFQTLLLSSANRKHLSFDYVEMIFLNFGLELFFLSLYVLSFVLAVI